jgi:nucleoside-diphosphate-sugar epimerase
MERTRVLITGGQGYVGSVLTGLLARNGFGVVVLDNNLIPGARVDSPNVSYVCGDVRDATDWQSNLDGVAAVVHLAAIVGDPACDVDRALASETNYLGTVQVADACRRRGVRKLIFASTCSNYGNAGQRELDIWSPLNPQSVYAETKILAEHYLLSLQGSRITPCILRFATIHGLSSRMRFDLAVNAMTANAVKNGVVTLNGGEQWRPFLHVRDAAQAVHRVLSVGRSDESLVYNCGSSRENYRLDQVAAIITEEVPWSRVALSHEAGDPRNYRVNFDRIRKELAFAGRHRVRDSVREIRDVMLAGSFPDFDSARYSNYLIAQGKLAGFGAGRPAADLLTTGRQT